MMLLHSYTYDLHERADIARLKRTYTLYSNGMFRTCGYDEAIRLLITGKWFDKTAYKQNEEVLTYEEPKRKRICSNEPEASSIWEESRHEQHQPNGEMHCSGTEDAREGNGDGSPRSEVKKRGRPKAVK